MSHSKAITLNSLRHAPNSLDLSSEPIISLSVQHARQCQARRWAFESVVFEFIAIVDVDRLHLSAVDFISLVRLLHHTISWSRLRQTQAQAFLINGERHPVESCHMNERRGDAFLLLLDSMCWTPSQLCSRNRKRWASISNAFPMDSMKSCFVSSPSPTDKQTPSARPSQGPICGGVLQDPLQIPACEHAFCQVTRPRQAQIETRLFRFVSSNGSPESPPVPSIEHRYTPISWRPFPEFSGPYSIGRSEKIHWRHLESIDSSLSISCDNDGCPAVVKLDALSAHLAECGYNPKKLIACEKGCGMMFSKEELTVGQRAFALVLHRSFASLINVSKLFELNSIRWRMNWTNAKRKWISTRQKFEHFRSEEQRRSSSLESLLGIYSCGSGQ